MEESVREKNTAAKIPGGLGAVLERLRESASEEQLALMERELSSLEPSQIGEVLSLAPRLRNILAVIIGAAARSLLQMDGSERREIILASLAEKRGEKVGETINDLSRLAVTLERESPDLLAEAESKYIDGLLQALDSGLLRKGIVSYVNLLCSSMEARSEKFLTDSVLTANLMVALPPVINRILALVSRSLTSVEMPSEILASALFNFISEIDTAALADVLNAVAGFIRDLHEGNLLLGRDEPRFREVFTRFSQELLDRLDKEGIALAVLALAEDAETMIRAMGDLLYRDPELLKTSIAAGTASLHALMRGITDAVNRISQLPPEKMAEVAGEYSESLDPKQAAELVNALALFSGKIIRSEPEILPRMMDEFFASLDGKVLREAFLEPLPAALSAWSERTGVSPARKAADLVSTGLASLRRTLESAPSSGDGLKEFLSGLDERELEGVMRDLSRRAAQALSEKPGLVKALVRPMFSAAWTYTKGTLGRWKTRLSSLAARGR